MKFETIITVVLVCILAGAIMILATGGIAAAETNCKAQCQKQQNRPPASRKTRYAAKSVRTIVIPTHIPDSHRRALMRMQPRYQRWAFTGFLPIEVNSDAEM